MMIMVSLSVTLIDSKIPSSDCQVKFVICQSSSLDSKYDLELSDCLLQLNIPLIYLLVPFLTFVLKKNVLLLVALVPT
jgi:hypothetical protein